MEDKLWLDATGRKLEVGQVITKAYKTSTGVAFRTGVIRSFKKTFIEVDFWSHANQELQLSMVRQTQQATITGLSETELLELSKVKTKPLSEVLS